MADTPEHMTIARFTVLSDNCDTVGVVKKESNQ